MALQRFDLAAYEAATGAERAALAASLDQICQETGFVVLTGHGVPNHVVTDLRAACATFFNLPPERKAETAAAGRPYGWIGPEQEALAGSKGEVTPPDLKESFNGGPTRVPDGLTDPDALAFCYQATPFPQIQGFKEAWQRYYSHMEALAVRIMAAFAAALGLPERFFDPFIDAPVSALRALNYPATGASAAPGQQRAGAHSDYGSLTILSPEQHSRGLEVFVAGEWIEVPAPQDAFVINIGDLMALWTADRWVSTLHRVAVHPNQPPRQSFAFFHQPNWSAEIAPLDGSSKFEPVQSGPYLMAKFQSTSIESSDS